MSDSDSLECSAGGDTHRDLELLQRGSSDSWDQGRLQEMDAGIFQGIHVSHCIQASSLAWKGSQLLRSRFSPTPPWSVIQVLEELDTSRAGVFPQIQLRLGTK